MSKRMNKKRIAFFLGGMTRGGAERVISILSKEYAKRNWDTDICVLLFYQLEYEIDDSTRFLDFTGEGKSRIRRVPYWIENIREYVKCSKPDVIVSFAAKINALVQIACVGIDVPIIVSERIDPRYHGRDIIIKILNNIFYPRAEKVVFQTRRIQAYFNKRIQANGCIILNPIEVTTYASEIRKKKIVTAGRIVPQKNQRLLIESFEKVIKKYPQYELFIYGEGELKEELVVLCEALGIKDSVYFPGNLPDIHRAIADAEIFVLSSDYEGLSNALMEAMMMGLPCISTDCSGADEIIEDGVNGLLVPVGHSGALADAIMRLIEQPELENSIGRKARESAEAFRTERIINRWIDIIG